MKSFQGGPRVNYKDYANRIPVTKFQGYKTQNFNDTQAANKYYVNAADEDDEIADEVESGEDIDDGSDEELIQDNQPMVSVTSENQLTDNKPEDNKPKRFFPSNYNPMSGSEILVNNVMRTKSGGKSKVEAKAEVPVSETRSGAGKARYLPSTQRKPVPKWGNQDPTRPKSSDYMFQQAARLSTILKVKQRDRTDRQSQINSMI